VPRSLVGRRDPNPPPVPAAVREAYRRNVLSLLSLQARAGDNGEEAYELRLAADAEAARVAFTAWLEPRLGEGGELGDIADWAGKLAGAVLRVAGLLHMADLVNERTSWDVPLPAATLGRAVQVARYLIEHAHAAFALMGMDPLVDAARFVLAWVRRKGLESFTEREAFEATKGRFKKVDALRPALALLANHGYVRLRAVDPRQGPGRKPSPAYAVNPFAHEQGPPRPAANDADEVYEEGVL